MSFADPAVSEGRYHVVGGPGVWYGSDREQAAWAELFRHFLEIGVDPFEVRRRVGKVTVYNLEVLDLTDDAIRAAVGLEPKDLVGDDYRRTRVVAHTAAGAGFGGILAPSAALPGRTTLVVFRSGMDQLAPGLSRVRQPPPRLVDLLHSIRPGPKVPLGVRSYLRSVAEVGSETVRRRRRRSR